MSGLTKKVIYTDANLAAILEVAEGTTVSYADISKGVHKYIKDHNLKSPHPAPTPSAISRAVPQPQTPAAIQPTGGRLCRSCGSEIPGEAFYCDLCGAVQ